MWKQKNAEVKKTEILINIYVLYTGLVDCINLIDCTRC